MFLIEVLLHLLTPAFWSQVASSWWCVAIPVAFFALIAAPLIRAGLRSPIREDWD